jgi:hypothetical protein
MRFLPYLSVVTLALGVFPGSRAADVVFEKDIQPILRKRCARCHGGETKKADLDLRTLASLLQGGKNGPAVSPGSPERSLVWIKVAGDKMPAEGEKLPEVEKLLMRTWIEGGAKGSVAIGKADERTVTEADRNFWSFRKPVRPPVPSVKQTEQVRNPIDAFLLAALEQKGLSYSPQAEPAILLRRLSFDLTGLPPTPEEVRGFLADKAPEAYERLVDRLLASPRYGERWGRHWLDVTGYADSEGILDADYVRTSAWRYRDYVIRSFNAGKPYDRFLQEQIAGDELTDYWTAYRTQKELPAEVVDGLIATGYLRCASDTSRPDFVNIKNAAGYYFQTLDDTLRIVATSTLGLTLQCARCHNHKYDPITQTEYYRLQAVFMSAYRPAQWVPQEQRRLLEGTEAQTKEIQEHNARIDAALAKLNQEGAAQIKQFGERLFDERLAKLPEPIREDVRAALAADPTKRTEVQKYLAEKFQQDLRPDAKTLPQILMARYPELAEQQKARTQAIQVETARRRSLPEIRALYDLPGEVKTHLLRRGDYLDPGDEVQPGVLTVLATEKPFQWQPPARESPTSYRRSAFASWLTQPDHPLTARVAVNRIWLHHFGEGIVATPDNFGRIGAPPSHPELLDWLATEFVDCGWDVKALHRRIVTSTAYRQASTLDLGRHAAAKRLDPEDRLLWRQRLRRLEAEPLRDAMLFTSGTLNQKMTGPPVPMKRLGDGEVVIAADPAAQRRSVYLQVRRSQPLTLLQVFDQPVMETNCPRRNGSTVPSQALTLLNSESVTQLSLSFADRVLLRDPADPVGQAVLLAFGRAPTDKERILLAGFLQTQSDRYRPLSAGGKDDTPQAHQEALRKAMADLCQMLLCANEFAYVD